jgi:hypothetical protein
MPAALAAPPYALLEPTRLVLTAQDISLLTILVHPAEARLSPAAEAGALHYFRLADATVRPLPPTPPVLACQPGDAYIAVTPAAAQLAAGEPGGASAAIARFLHLRDYFNADKLAAALLAHLVELGGDAGATGAGVLVVEAR